MPGLRPGAVRHEDEGEEEMRATSTCPHDLPLGRILERVLGIQRDEKGEPELILWECMCNGSVAVPWGNAGEELKEKAERAEQEKRDDDKVY